MPSSLQRALVLTIVLAVSGHARGSAESLSVLTYNVWHGFWRTAAKEVVVLPAEPNDDRKRRAELQGRQLGLLEPDVVMAQEVHPLPWRARDLARDVDHDSIHQLVSCGVRFLHLGVPWEVRSGLAVTAARELDLERVGAPVLSGRFGFCRDWLGLQLEEARRALMGSIELADGRRVLLVTTHLHSSTEGGAARSERRQREVEALLDAIESAREEDPEIAGVILGGDLNASSGSTPIETLRTAGFIDAAQRLGVEFPTYDPWTNPLAALMTEAGGGDPAKSRPRRIDYIFVSRELELNLRSVEAYGRRPAESPDNEFDSDHYGVLVKLDF